MIFNKTAIAALIAMAVAGTASSKISVPVNGGWKLSIDGQMNHFMIMTNDKNRDDINEIRGGFAGSFLGFNFIAPKKNDYLALGARISFSPSTNLPSSEPFEQREVYFTIDTEFGQILAGKALGLYGSHNLLTEQTIMGVGYGTGMNSSGTLGGIGFGYDYASWRPQVRWTSKEFHGFQIAVALVDNGGSAQRLSHGLPAGSIKTGTRDSKDLRYEGDIKYTEKFKRGQYMLWISGMNTGNDVANKLDVPHGETALTTGGTLDIDSFKFMAQYSNSKGSIDLDLKKIANSSKLVANKVKWNQYVVQAGYTFNKVTLVSANYSRLRETTLGVDSNKDSAYRWTIGVYHDVTENLKIVSEFTNIQHEYSPVIDYKVFSLGGQFLW